MSVLSVRGSQSPVSRRVGLACGLVCLALAVLTAWARADHDTHLQGHIRAGPPPVEIYPTAERLPANLLRLYLVFDGAMSTGESRAHLRLVDDGGREVQRAFLQLEQELWDRSGRRLTVLFDPGRIKRGLRANVESGPPLVEGRRYRLVVDGGWRYADGRPLGRAVSKAFEAGAPDRTAPDIDAWAIEPPSPGTRASLVLRFPEILDRALLSSGIDVVGPAGEPIRGDIGVAPGERDWAFTPERAWRTGEYRIRVSAQMEDVAGNSLLRVFDAEMIGSHAVEEDVPSFLMRRFSISGTKVRLTSIMRPGVN